ncbi:transport permease protein [Thiosulfatimonas sediminis]|uniref:Transport permease protein n=1 Tax=Thiosulfatimonas sediminis TaxID=2675054 RepID=A0A6F8PVZ3_9GAMM|nr:ABC transporter permease [Thiosulfatimonas sediminis]BBP46174.1 transport permease protein [Thiosulfatimonas sediminis]
MQVRSAWQVTRNVYYALFMREVLTRLFANRMAWFWLFVEPILFVVVMVGLRSFIRVMDQIGGVDMIPWMIIGLAAFFMFRDGMNNGMNAIGAGKALFAYRQLKPIDTVIVRIFTIGLLHLLVLLIFVIGMLLLGFTMTPHNLLLSMGAWLTLWFFGLGVGLTLAVVTQFATEFGKIINVLSLPLMILSGAFLPFHHMPHAIQEILLWNPVLHAIELIRIGFFEGYWTLSGINYQYLFIWTVGSVFLGISLNLRFEARLKVK